MKAQVEKTVEQHLAKELTLKGKGIKVLSLFFVDRVSNYRIYHDNGAEKALGKIGQWFEDAYRDCMKRPRFMELPSYDVKQVHNGYFSKDKKQKPKDTRGNTKDDESTYNLIMREKEKLLDEAEPLRFIFSHSALREGWDNPNVFQICTLNETKSKDKKRQEIGRGLRLPVNRDGERVHDETVNRLTVVANEAYEEFARTLQEELEEECGIRFGVVREIDFAELSAPDADGQEVELGQDGSRRLWKALVEQGYLDQSGAIQPAFNPADPSFDCEVPQEFAHLKPQIIDLLNGRIFKNRVVNVAERRQVKFRKKVQLGDAFKELWERIKHRTRYRVKFKTDDLIKKAVARIGELDDIKPARIKISRARLDIELYGVDTGDPVEDYTVDAAPVSRLPDILAYLQKETELTRHTLAEILKQCGKLGQFRLNPQAFMLAVGKAISRALQDLMLEGIQYDKVPGNHWEMSRIAKDAEAGVVRYLHNLYQVQSKGKTLFDAIEYDSEVERKFAQDLDNNEHVRLFVKLPGWFKIDTPIGPYNPDWAFVTERDEKLYFVRETKSTLDTDELRVSEKRKIDCGKQHFKALGVDFGVVTELSEVPIR